jgi:hypothetical protein
MSNATSAPTPGAPAEPNSLARLFGAIFSPKPTFESIARRPTWLLPILLGCIVFIGVVAAFSYRGGWQSFMEKQDANNSRVQNMSPEAREKLIQTQAKIAPIFGYVEGVIVPFTSALAVAGVLLGAFTITGTTKTDFKTSLGIVAFASTPWLIHGLLGTLIVFLKDPSTVDLQNLVASNAGAFLSGDAPKWLAALLGSIDIFSIWNLALLGIGFSATNPKKLSFGGAFGTVLAIWSFYVILKVALIAAFTMLS